MGNKNPNLDYVEEFQNIQHLLQNKKLSGDQHGL